MGSVDVRTMSGQFCRSQHLRLDFNVISQRPLVGHVHPEFN